MPGYARTLRLIAAKLEQNEKILEEHANDELTELEGEIEELGEQLNQAISVAEELIAEDEADDEEDE